MNPQPKKRKFTSGLLKIYKRGLSCPPIGDWCGLMISIEFFLESRFPELQVKRPLFFKTLSVLLKQLFHEQEFKQFEEKYPHLVGLDFIEQVLNYFDFSFSVLDKERERIPLTGKLVIVANHPIGSLDGLALLKLISEVRHDVKVVGNEVLSAIEPMQSLLLGVDNMGGSSELQQIKAIHKHLENDGAVIFFPAGEVSRFGPKGIKDGKWRSGFLKVASRHRAPILPIFVDGRNSTFFYSLSLLAKPLSTLWLIREMFKQSNQSLKMRIGDPIRFQNYSCVGSDIKQRTALFRRHVYNLQRPKKAIFTDLAAVAHPENRQQLRKEIRQSQLLGKTGDGKEIYLFHYAPDSCVMREIGRLRELSFRAVGEGTGKRRDMDQYDCHYQHLVLWDEQELEIVGSYRIGVAKDIISKCGVSGLYSSTLFDYQPAMDYVFERGLELGRSFVQPSYWGKRSLDYLWFGLGAFLREHPHFRYLFGPVSLSSDFNETAKATLVHVYQHYYGSKMNLAAPKIPYEPDYDELVPQNLFCGTDYKEDFKHLKSFLAGHDVSIPTLYKQYIDVCEQDGVQFAGFNIDPDFSNCIDGLIVVDTVRLKTKKRARYIDGSALELEKQSAA